MNLITITEKLKKHQYSTIQNSNLGITFEPLEVSNLVKKAVNTFYFQKRDNIEINLLSNFETIQVISKGQLITVIVVTENLVLIELSKHKYIALNLGGFNL